MIYKMLAIPQEEVLPTVPLRNKKDAFLKAASLLQFVFLLSARGETRTPKDITPTASETATFANFATRAARGDKSMKFLFPALNNFLT